MAEPPPIDEEVLNDGDVSVMDGRSSSKSQVESAVLSRLEQQVQEIKSLKAAFLEQKELYLGALNELAIEKKKNKALAASLEELQAARGEASSVPNEQLAPASTSDYKLTATAGAETARLNEKVRAYELEIRSLRDDVKAWDEAAALDHSKIQQLQLELASTVDGKENALKVLQEATLQVKKLEEELEQQKGVPRQDKTEQSHSNRNFKRACSYSMSQVADLEAESEALKMNLDVAQRNLRETERLRENDARVIERMRVECERLTALVAANTAELDGAKPHACIGTEGLQQSSLSHQKVTLQHDTTIDMTPCFMVEGTGKVENVIAAASLEGSMSGEGAHEIATAEGRKTPLEEGECPAIAEGTKTPSGECPAADISQVQTEGTSDASLNWGAQAAPEHDTIHGPLASGTADSRQEGEVGVGTEQHTMKDSDENRNFKQGEIDTTVIIIS